jgi:hypothetical protein
MYRLATPSLSYPIESIEGEVDVFVTVGLLNLRLTRSLPVQKPCERLFRQLAATDPAGLEMHIEEPSYSAGLRARAVKAAEDIKNSLLARQLLLPLLASSEPIIQEAAIYALEPHMTESVRERLASIASDRGASEGVRAAAREVVDEFEGT